MNKSVQWCVNKVGVLLQWTRGAAVSADDVLLSHRDIDNHYYCAGIYVSRVWG